MQTKKPPWRGKLWCAWQISTSEPSEQWSKKSFVFEYSDAEIFSYFKNNDFYNNDIYNRLKDINIASKTIKQIIEVLIDEFDIINKLTKIGSIEKNLSIIEYLMNYVDTKENVGFTLRDFIDYLGEILDKKYEIKFSSNINAYLY